MRRRVKKKLGLLVTAPLPESVDSAIRLGALCEDIAAYRVLARLITTGSMHGYAAMETMPNGDGTFTHRVAAPSAR